MGGSSKNEFEEVVRMNLKKCNLSEGLAQVRLE